MRRALSVLALVSLASLANAQAPAVQAPAAPAPADSVKPRRSPVYLTLLLDLHSARLISGEGGNGDETTPGMGSFDFSVQSSRRGGVGLGFRSVGGAEAYDYAEVALLLGSRSFSVDVGAASRSGYNQLTDNLNDTTYRFARVGARSRVNLGNTDFSVTMRGAGYINIPTAEDELLPSNLNGFSFESGLSWTWARYPITANLGYRIEKFRVFDVEQETSSLVLGGGLVLGRRD
jgi:hypothetical protein